ncbi:C40 family peptidase [Nocardia brasiliensis]|uniref:C40 family peptidase n=1 Tax=Nocardia brasiliensis TaxID=37326 RepID=UPI002456B489|nr:NlpC/P60 family protein [Nocardia brasiliensis]
MTGDLQALLQTMLGLYGSGRPEDAAATVASASHTADLRGLNGVNVKEYSGALDMQAAVAASQADRDGVVHKAVGSTGDGTVSGRGRLAHQIADFQSKIQAIASVGDARFTGPALLAAAQTTIGNATRQVNADVAAAQRQAAQIMPAPAANLMPAPRPVVNRRRSRRRNRPRLGSPERPRRRMPVPTDGTAGGAAVSAASGWLGAKYVWGGGGAGGPSGGGFDCSGLTQYAIAQATNGEVLLPRTTYDQIHSGVRVHPAEVQPGDLVFPASSWSAKGPEHVQLAAGSGMVIEAPTFGVPVKYSRMPADAVVVRVLGQGGG